MGRCMAGFAQVPAELLEAPVSAAAKLLWAVLDRHQRDNGHTWTSRAHLAEHLDCSRSSVARALVELEASGWLVIDSGGGRGRTNRYVLRGRPADIHNGVTSGPFQVLNGVTSGPFPAKRSAGDTGGVSPADTEERTRERDTGGSSSAQGATARVCELGRLVADDGTCCPEHDYGQIPMWPAPPIE